MKTQFQKYYQSEFQNAWMRILAGSILGIVAGIAYYEYPNELLEGIWWSIFAVSIYQVARGVKKMLRAIRLRKLIAAQWERQSSQLIANELDYLKVRLPKYKFHRTIEIIFISAGLIVAFLGSVGNFGLFMVGTGLGLAIQGSISLYLELVAEWYAGIFYSRLEKRG